MLDALGHLLVKPAPEDRLEAHLGASCPLLDGMKGLWHDSMSRQADGAQDGSRIPRPELGMSMQREKTKMKAEMRRFLFGLAGAALVSLFAPAALAKGPVIALSNAYYGNTWRHQMVESVQAVAEEAKKQGLISDYIILNGDGSVNQQMSQMSDLILKHVDGIIIDAASNTALNGIIAKACSAGIKVLAFDSIVSAPCSYKLNFDFKGYMT
ncbi:MAG TPA: substrate-binding domain-containing protein, partial [Rhizomicrobium sp.]|nr:substrate-binding domain-containing protein [Rhizomicrobium sp.]